MSTVSNSILNLLEGFGRACAPLRCAHPSSWALPRQTGRCAPPLSAHRSFAVSYFTPKNILNLSNLGRPRQGPFSFHQEHRGQNYVPVPPYALFFLVFLFYSFWIFSSYSSLLISSYSSRRCYSSSSFSSPLIF